MTDGDRIKSALRSLQGDGFGDRAAKLLNVLGYHSTRIVDEVSMQPEEFVKMYAAESTKSEDIFVSEARSVQVLFQVTDNEMDGQARLDAASYDKSVHKSFLFVAIELKRTTYPRGRYAAFTREINKRLKIPAVVLFRTPDSKCTLGFIHRREGIRDPSHHVLERVSLVREISSLTPHRAHVDILHSLSMPERLGWIVNNRKRRNFDGLHDAWLAALDTEELNKRFYHDLYDWFERAVEQASLPKNIQSQEHILRLITRLLFVWFVKQKGLVNNRLFNEHDVKDILVRYDPSGDSYYRAILQNLFFATLNTEIGRRGFGDTNTSYHYKHEIKDAEVLLELFNQAPFINGGLFDCLDEGANRADYFVDDISERHGYSVPNQLFFGKGNNLGLLTIFNKYHFTVEESTPLEQEVALDPELLGRVFENLLAAYNPETSDTVRKQTGSYYTPREVVDYIADKTLAASLAGKMCNSAESAEAAKEKVQKLLDYSTMPDDLGLTDKERDGIVRAISQIKILDPAVGSGAFLVSVLHKLTLVLNRIDPENKIWMKLQTDMAKERAGEIFKKVNTGQRDEQLRQTNTVFERYGGDFGRKLYLIQNNIYGVDIQPIAIQIAKLRFFISLVIEQDTISTNPEDNYGVQPLPNLETRFVAANTLVPLNKPPQQTIGQTNDDVRRLESELTRNREQYFLASCPEAKAVCRDNDARLRHQLASAVNKAGDAGYVNEMAKWDPYDQNHSSGWFDAKYMFGISDGFDSVIGNPPYIKSAKIRNKGQVQLPVPNNLGHVGTIDRRADISVYFFMHALNILKDSGLLGFISTDSWLHFGYGTQPQAALLRCCDVVSLARPKARIFRDAQIRTVVSIARKNVEYTGCVVHFSPDLGGAPRKMSGMKPGNWLAVFWEGLLPKPKVDMVSLGDVCDIVGGVETGHDAFYILSEVEVALAGIDRKYLEPILTKPIAGHAVYESSPHKFLFHVQDHEGTLVRSKEGMRVKEYIDGGNPKGKSKGGMPRYHIKLGQPAPILISMQINDRVRVYENVERMVALRKFTYVTPHKTEHTACHLAYLSSSYFALYQEIWGHPMGGGLLKFQIEDYAKSPVPNFSEVSGCEKLVVAWEAYKTSLDLDALDAAVFDVLGIGDVEDVRKSLSELVGDRMAATKR